MSFILLLAVGTAAQSPSFQFRNEPPGGQRITIFVWCEIDNDWANNRRAIVLDAGQSSRLNLHPGHFVVVAKNQFGVEHRLRRVLAPGEVDRLKLSPVYGAPSGHQPPPDFVIKDNN